MGCGCSSSSASDASSAASEWTSIGLPKWDDFFNDGNKLASEIKSVKNGLRDSRNFIFRKLKIYYLKPPKDNMLEAFKVFCWAISA